MSMAFAFSGVKAIKRSLSKADRRNTILFTSMTLAEITGFQAFIRETYEQGTGNEFTELPGNIRRSLLFGEYIGGVCLAIFAMQASRNRFVRGFLEPKHLGPSGERDAS